MVFSADQNVVDCFYPTALDETRDAHSQLGLVSFVA